MRVESDEGSEVFFWVSRGIMGNGIACTKDFHPTQWSQVERPRIEMYSNVTNNSKNKITSIQKHIRIMVHPGVLANRLLIHVNILWITSCAMAVVQYTPHLLFCPTPYEIVVTIGSCHGQQSVCIIQEGCVPYVLSSSMVHRDIFHHRNLVATHTSIRSCNHGVVHLTLLTNISGKFRCACSNLHIFRY